MTHYFENVNYQFPTQIGIHFLGQSGQPWHLKCSTDQDLPEYLLHFQFNPFEIFLINFWNKYWQIYMVPIRQKYQNKHNVLTDFSHFKDEIMFPWPRMTTDNISSLSVPSLHTIIPLGPLVSPWGLILLFKELFLWPSGSSFILPINTNQEIMCLTNQTQIRLYCEWY